MPRNVLGGELEPCSYDPLTGYNRDGCCTTGGDDYGVHTVCAVMTDEFKQRLAADGTEPLASTPEEYAADIDKEETKWSAIVKKSGAKEQ